MKFDWKYFFDTLPYIASKLDVTLSLTIISSVFSLLIGLAFALVSYYNVKGLSQILKVWSSFMRGTPAAAQMFFFYYGMANISSLILNMSPVVAVAVIMSLNMGAFVAESIRGALLSVDNGQREAAMSLGMSGFQMTMRIVVPQAVRVALPPLFNDIINLFKMSSLAFLVGVRDVMGASKIEGAQTFKFFECYACVMLIFWVITILLTSVQKRLEKKCSAIY
ncbi:MAG: amino acid ABC transporter permease [Clostridiaceae bacterium]|nr:amino acid ABC transporter permease [Clostridiaceae bacterium]